MVLQDNATTGNGTPVDLSMAGTTFTFYTAWADGCTGGQVVWETAPTLGFAGTWIALKTANFGDYTVQCDGVAQPLAAVRARIATTVSGGSAPGVTCTVEPGTSRG